jgi:hypothetical protein
MSGVLDSLPEEMVYLIVKTNVAPLLRFYEQVISFLPYQEA